MIFGGQEIYMQLVFNGLPYRLNLRDATLFKGVKILRIWFLKNTLNDKTTIGVIGVG